MALDQGLARCVKVAVEHVPYALLKLLGYELLDTGRKRGRICVITRAFRC
jgi:hypothetical protein